MATQGLTPIAFALGGVIAAFVPLPLLISICFGTVVFVGIPFMFMASFRRFINFDPARDTVESVR
jgi:DHA3 family macrolide efflux protein-like MFS transporter